MKAVGSILVAILLLSALAFATGGHEDLGCTGCHSMHDAKGTFIFEVPPNTESLNPRTGGSFSGVTALCLGCHEETGGEGILPVMGASSHPYGVTPNRRIANVPHQALRDGKLECVGCHDPHPSNPNFRYLRVDTARGADMPAFCSTCHSSKSGRMAGETVLFTSMDERAAPVPEPVPDLVSQPEGE